MSESFWHISLSRLPLGKDSSKLITIPEVSVTTSQIISKSNTAIYIQTHIINSIFSPFSFFSRIFFTINSWDYNTIL